MYEVFQTIYKEDVADSRGAGYRTPYVGNFESIPGFRELFDLFGGASFNKGIYRVVRAEDVASWVRHIREAFPDFSDRAAPFGYDWLGRLFCVDVSRALNLDPQILLFSNFSNEVLKIPAGIPDFHDAVLVEQQEAALEMAMFSSFLAASQLSRLHVSQCAEVVIPLYLGGTYSIENLRIADVTTNWDIAAQLLVQSRAVDDGARIEKVSLRKP